MLKRRVKKIGDNKFLIILIIVAILISIVGTFFSINMLDELEDYKEYFTGYGTSGQVNLTITQNLSIYIVQMNMSFGEGEVTTGKPHAHINSSEPSPTSASYASVNWTNTTEAFPNSFELRNDGNVNASVTLESSAAAAAFMGGTDPQFQYNASNKEISNGKSCVEGNNIQDWTDVTTGATTVCDNLGSLDARDELYIDVKIGIPNDASGAKEAFFTFSASAVT